MSEQLEAAIESVRQMELATDEADTTGSTEAFGDALGHMREAVNHLVGAVQHVEAQISGLINHKADA